MLPLSIGRLGTLQGGNASLVLVLVKATIILMGALLVTLIMQRAAAGARHLVWLVTLGALLLVPVLTVWGPIHLGILPARVELPDGPARGPVGVTSQNVVSQIGEATHEGASVAAPPSDASPSQQQASAAPTLVDAVTTRLRGADPLVILFAIWAAIALMIAASLAYATLALHRVVTMSRPLNDRDWLNAVWEVSDRLGLERAPRLLQSSDVKMPFACGLLHPTIVLPIESSRWSAERRSAVLLHELAHVRRRDLVGHTLGRVACAVYWFHPLVWTAAKRLRSESERACDDLALTCGTHAADYAEHLLDIVTSVRGDRTPSVALAMARRKEFEGRMLAILDPQLKRSVPSPRKTAALVASLGALSVVVGAAAPTPRAAPAAPSHAVAMASAGTTMTAPIASVSSPQAPANVGISAGDQDARVPASHIFTSRASTGQSRSGAAHDATVTAPDPTQAIVTAVRPFVDQVVASLDVNELMSAMTSASAHSPGADGKTPDERADLLVKVLQTDSSAKLRRTAAWGLARYAEIPAASDALAAALQHDANARVRETAAWALARDGRASAAVAQALGNALVHDASDSVRATAAWALGSFHDRAPSEPLTTALADKSAAVRMRAVWALGRARNRPAPAALVAKLRDSDPKVRELTAWALFTIRDPATVPALQSALHAETDSDIQVDYIRALASMGDSSLDAIRSLLESPDPKVKSMAVNALAGGQAAGPWPWPWPDPRPFP